VPSDRSSVSWFAIDETVPVTSPVRSPIM